MGARPLTSQLKGAPGVETLTIDTTPIATIDSSFKVGIVGWTPKGEPNTVISVRGEGNMAQFGTAGQNYIYNQPFYATDMLLAAGATVQFVRVAAVKEYLSYYTPSFGSTPAGNNASSAVAIVPSAGASVGYAGHYNDIDSVLADGPLFSLSPYSGAESPMTIWSKYPGMDTISVSIHTHVMHSAGPSASFNEAFSNNDVYVTKAIQNLGFYNEYSASNPFTDIVGKLGVMKVYDSSNLTGAPLETITFTNDYFVDGNGIQYFIEEVTKNSKYIRVKMNRDYTPSWQTWLGHGAKNNSNKASLTGGNVSTYAQAISKWASAWKLFLDKDSVKVNCLCAMGTNLTGFGSEIAGIPNEAYNTNVIAAMKDVCNIRQTCFGIIDAPKFSKIEDLIKATEESIPGSEDYNCLFLYDNRDAVVDVKNKRNIEMAKSVTAAAVMSIMRRKTVLWDIPANVQNGSLPYPIIGQAYKRQYPDHIGPLNEARINSTRISNKGMYLYGNRTLQRANTPQRDINVIALKCYAYEVIQDFLDDRVFRLNTPELRREIDKFIKIFLGGIKSATPSGLADFSVQCDDDNNPAEVVNQRRLIVETKMIPYLGAEAISFYNYIKFAGEDI